MADIRIDNLSGFDLLNDSESFMSDLSEESVRVQGGGTPTIVLLVVTLLWPNEAH